MRRVYLFIRSRLNSGAWALVVLVTIGVLLDSLSETLTVAHLPPSVVIVPHWTLFGLWVGVVALLALAATIFWALNAVARMRTAIVLINGVFTAQLFVAALLIVLRLVQSVKVTPAALIVDAVVIFATNILIFALWYWFVDSANMRLFGQTSTEVWHFLFPQRQADYPGYADWRPQFSDYLFLAYTTSVAFSPADTLPLSHTAKLMMMTESAISFIAIVVVAGTAINILAGNV